VVRVFTLGIALALLAAACGPPGPKRYSEPKSRACMVTSHLHVVPLPATDFVANTALGGAFRVKLPHNAVTVSFGDTVDNGTQLADAYRNVAAKNVRAGIDDVLRTNGNAVMLWHAHPSDADLSLIQGCLKT
jgi:hypothetical protein